MRKFDVPEDLLLPEKSGELFFAQRVAELSYMYSRESYRVSTTTVPFLARECLAVIEDYRTLDLHISTVERVLAELKRRSHQNVIVSQLARMPLDSYFSKDIDNIGSVEDALRVFAKEMTPLKYLREACSAIIRCAPNEKENADFIASELVCTLVNMGISQEYIYEQSVKIFFSDPPPEGASRIEIFMQKMREVEVGVPKFSAIIPLKSGLGEINHSVLKLFFAETIEHIPEEFQAPAEFVKEVEGKHLLLMKGVTSLDYISAAKLVKRNIVRIQDLLGLFYHKGTNDVGPSILVTRLGQPDSSVVVRCDQNLMQMISDNPRTLAARKLETMIKTLRLPRGEDSEKFFRVVEFHGMSLSSPIPENQLINLWTSLETVVPSLKGKSIIGSVCKGALPIIGIQYISRTFLTVAKDIKRWNDKKFKAAIRKIDSGKGIIEKTFLLICDPQYDEVCTCMLAEMDDFPLLKHRIFQLHKRFKTGKNAAEQIRLHMTKAEQQLHRIYRTRNSIVHSAQKDHLTENLIISAHEYFDQIFSATVEICSKPFMFDNYRDAFNYFDMAFNSYIQTLDAMGDKPISDARALVWSAT